MYPIDTRETDTIIRLIFDVHSYAVQTYFADDVNGYVWGGTERAIVALLLVNSWRAALIKKKKKALEGVIKALRRKRGGGEGGGIS